MLRRNPAGRSALPEADLDRLGHDVDSQQVGEPLGTFVPIVHISLHLVYRFHEDRERSLLNLGGAVRIATTHLVARCYEHTSRCLAVFQRLPACPVFPEIPRHPLDILRQ